MANSMGRSQARFPWKVLSGPLASAFAYLLLPALPDNQRIVASVFAGAVVLWISEALPLAVTAMLSTLVLGLTGAVEPSKVFASYGDPTIFLFVGSFILAKAMSDTGLGVRITHWLLSIRAASRSLSAIFLSLGVVATTISLFVSNTATTAMLLPIGLAIVQSIGEERRGKPAIGILLMLTWGSSLAVGTIVGTPPNVIGVKLISEATGQRINFVDWAIFAMPITIVMLLIAWFVLRGMYGTKDVDTRDAWVKSKEKLRELGPMTDGERSTLAAFGLSLSLWILPGALVYLLGADNPTAAWLAEHLPESYAALIGAFALFVLPWRNSTTGYAMSWKSASGIDWGTILLFGGGIALGKATLDTGLAQSVGEAMKGATGADSTWSIAALAIGLSIAMSEIASNTAAATTVVPIAIGLAEGAGVSPIPAALGAALGSNFGFMLPISTPPNAIVYSSGYIPPATMMKTGILFDVISFLIVLGALRLILPMMGLS